MVLADVEHGALARRRSRGIGGDAVGGHDRRDVDGGGRGARRFHAYDTFGAVHVLCNNAGVFQGGLMWECTDADFEWTLGVNVMGIVHGVRAFVPACSPPAPRGTW